MPDRTSLIIFGASGDLTQRKLIPALFSLYCKERLPDRFQIVGMSRTEMSDEEWREEMHAALNEFAPEKAQEGAWADFAAQLTYVTGDFKDHQAIQRLHQALASFEGDSRQAANRLFYLATPPHVYEAALNQFGETGLVSEDGGWRRVIIEKPFGHDLESARRLNQVAHKVLAEEQIYRIDHYLGKETVQNVLVFRFANSIFEPIWNRNYVDHVQITVAESVGVGHRGDFYDQVGILKDMFQNHLMQLLSLVAMEAPASFDSTAIRNERVKVLKSLRPVDPTEVEQHSVRGQYQDYRAEPGVASDSHTATYAALRLYVDNWRWQGVPFYLRSGKALSQKTTEIHVQFASVPHLMFPLEPGAGIRPNAIDICIQPDEGIHLRFEAKVPDMQAKTRSVDMEFHYADEFGPGSIPDAYERLLLDALKGDASLFTRADTIELAWALIDRFTEGWQGDKAPQLAQYERGSWGPEAADQLLAEDGREWTLGCAHDT